MEQYKIIDTLETYQVVIKISYAKRLMLDKEDNLMGYVFLYPKRYIVLDHPTC